MKWSMRRRAANQARLMGSMMAKVGVDPVEAARIGSGATLAAAARRCLQCESTAECGRWLEKQDDGTAIPPGFCPNADFFARVRAIAP